MATQINHEERSHLEVNSHPIINQLQPITLPTLFQSIYNPFFEGVIYTSGGSDLTFLFVIDGVLSSSNKLKCFQL